MAPIPPALWFAPQHFPDHAKNVFHAIANPVAFASRLVRSWRLHEFDENDFYTYYREMPQISKPLWEIVDHRRPVPARIWKCAFKICQAVKPFFEDLEHLFLDANFPWTGSQ